MQPRRATAPQHLLGQHMGHVQAQTGMAARPRAGHEGAEDLLMLLQRYATAVVAHSQLQAVTFLDQSNMDQGARSAGLESMGQRVVDQLVKNSYQGTGVALGL